MPGCLIPPGKGEGSIGCMVKETTWNVHIPVTDVTRASGFRWRDWGWSKGGGGEEPVYWFIRKQMRSLGAGRNGTLKLMVCTSCGKEE